MAIHSMLVLLRKRGSSLRIAITGGTGFVGSHFARSLVAKGHEAVIISRGYDKRNKLENELMRFAECGTSDVGALVNAFEGCDAVAHCAGINREINPGDYDLVHVRGTENVVAAARQAGLGRIALLSFFRARPNCNSNYHESKFAAEEIVRNSGINYTIFKAGMIYGRGDHLLDHLSHIFYTVPLFGLVGFSKKSIAPIAVEDMVKLLCASLLEGSLQNQTVAVLGPDKITLAEAVQKVGGVIGKTPFTFPMPVFMHYAMARVLEATMVIPLISVAQVRMLAEGFDEPYGKCDLLPSELMPSTSFTEDQIRKGLPPPGPFSAADLRFK